MEMNQYQAKAMETCVEKSANTAYMLTGLTAEVGEINDKVAKWIRKGEARFDNNYLVFNTSDIKERNAHTVELVKELGDVLWFVAGLATRLGVSLEDVASINLEKLASRKQRGVIVGNGDNR
jgi:NTP pyrophosphatase (non-canonical NTP hydrolase)